MERFHLPKTKLGHADLNQLGANDDPVKGKMSLTVRSVWACEHQSSEAAGPKQGALEFNRHEAALPISFKRKWDST